MRKAAIFLALMLPVLAAAQDAAKPAPISTQARLVNARTIYLDQKGARLPYEVIEEAFRGWAHYTFVGDPTKADLIVIIEAPTTEGGVSVQGRSSDGQASESHALSSVNIVQIRLLVRDAHDGLQLWIGTEKPQSAMKQRDREDHAVDASLKLFRRFRNLVEPEPAQ